MADLIRSETLKAAARLTSRLAEINQPDRNDPWKGTYLISAGRGHLRLVATDGTTRLEWLMSTDGLNEDDSEELVDAAQFDKLPARLIDGERYEIARDGGLLLVQSGSSPSRPGGTTVSLRLAKRACPAFPPRNLTTGSDGPARHLPCWIVPAAPLARALAFVAPFIGTRNPNTSRSVATWMPAGDLVGGSPTKAVRVVGLPSALAPLSFRRRTALVVATFLERVGGDVEVRVGGAYYSFTSTRDGHVLELRGEPAPFPVELLALDEPPLEAWRIDRKELLNCLEILAVFLPTRGDKLEFRVRGNGENSVIRISTPGTPTTRSCDEIAIFRATTPPTDRPDPPPTALVGTIPEISFWADGRLIQRVLSGMRAISITCQFDPVRRRIRLIEAPLPGEIVRSVSLAIKMPRRDDNRNHLVTNPVRIASDELGREPPEAPGIEHLTGIESDDRQGVRRADARESKTPESEPASGGVSQPNESLVERVGA